MSGKRSMQKDMSELLKMLAFYDSVLKALVKRSDSELEITDEELNHFIFHPEELEFKYDGKAHKAYFKGKKKGLIL